ncbi:NAD(P)/FAD-dependent oxidoreductase [Halovenus salina]|uniref:NAD(P)/FAD-dependent oxidoreductase n=1 Tax=Halovenus salina TaxID=1510225 RepID=UPI0022609A02|nr:FAD-dependent oxidoreductase [Halovenus salina]
MHVAVLGAGYAGVTLTRTLERQLPESAEITLVDERDTHLVQHLLHRAVRNPEIEDQLQVPLEECCQRATIREATVESVDADEGRVNIDDGTLSYDIGAICLGARTAYYGLSGVRSRATPLKRLEDAREIRSAFLDCCEDGGRVVVGGAGLSGVQVAGELADLAREEGAESAVDVVLLEQKADVAPGFPEPFQNAVADALDCRGIDVRTGTTVTGADETTLTTDAGTTIEYDQLVWTGGITGQPSLGDTRRQVQSTLRLGRRTFGLGDAVRVIDDEGERVPATAQSAVGQASVAAENIAALADSGVGGFEPRLSRYVYRSRGWVVTVGDATVAQVGSRVLRGKPAKALKTSIGVRHLAGVGAVEDAVAFVRESVGGSQA